MFPLTWWTYQLDKQIETEVFQSFQFVPNPIRLNNFKPVWATDTGIVSSSFPTKYQKYNTQPETRLIYKVWPGFVHAKYICYLQTAVLPSPRQHLQQRRSELVQAKEIREHHTVHGCQLTPTCIYAHTNTVKKKKAYKESKRINLYFKASHLLLRNTILLSHKSFLSISCNMYNTKVLGQNKHANDWIQGKVKQCQNYWIYPLEMMNIHRTHICISKGIKGQTTIIIIMVETH